MTTTQTATTTRKTSMTAKPDVPPGLETLASRLSADELAMLARRPDVFRQHVETALALAEDLDAADALEAQVQELAEKLTGELGEEMAERVARERVQANIDEKAAMEAEFRANIRRARQREETEKQAEESARLKAEAMANKKRLLEIVRTSTKALLDARLEIMRTNPGMDASYARRILGAAIRSAGLHAFVDFMSDAELMAQVQFGFDG